MAAQIVHAHFGPYCYENLCKITVLQRELAIRLNPSKTILQPLDRGIDHLGYWLKPNYTLVRRKNVITCRARLASKELLKNKQGQRAIRDSYLGLFRHADGYRLSQSLICMLAWIFLPWF